MILNKKYSLNNKKNDNIRPKSTNIKLEIIIVKNPGKITIQT